MLTQIDDYFITYTIHQDLVDYIESALSVYVSICIDTMCLLLLDQETRLSIEIAPLSGNPLADLKKIAIEWCYKIIIAKIEYGWVTPIGA
tara:strand:+ start:81 stop:350 length:270 start_codon:yes stop_codon:yes gene_type:complete